MGVAALVAAFLLGLYLFGRDEGIDPAASNSEPGLVVTTGADKDDLGWPNCTMRVVIPGSAVLHGGAGISVKFGAGPSRKLHIVEAFIGEALQPAALKYNFEDTPKQLSFGGAKSVEIAPGGSLVSDQIGDLSLSRGSPVLVSYYLDGKGDDPVAKSPTLGWYSYYKCNFNCVEYCELQSLAGEARVFDFEDRSAKFVSHGVEEVRASRMR
jgi:hypothetical protein